MEGLEQPVFSELYRYKYEKYKLKYRTLAEQLKRSGNVKMIGDNLEVADIPLEKAKELYEITNMVIMPEETDILLITTVSDLDAFTDRYGKLKGDEITIDWQDVSNDYQGFGFDDNKEVKDKILNKNKTDSRYFQTKYNGTLYKSWINGEYFYDVIVFI